MPALTDDFLGTLFVEAGDAFEVPTSGASDIVGSFAAETLRRLGHVHIRLAYSP